VAASEHPRSVLPKAVEAFRLLATGLLMPTGKTMGQVKAATTESRL